MKGFLDFSENDNDVFHELRAPHDGHFSGSNMKYFRSHTCNACSHLSHFTAISNSNWGINIDRGCGATTAPALAEREVPITVDNTAAHNIAFQPFAFIKTPPFCKTTEKGAIVSSPLMSSACRQNVNQENNGRVAQ